MFGLDRFTEVRPLPEDDRERFGYRVAGSVRRTFESASRPKEQTQNESVLVEGANCVG